MLRKRRKVKAGKKNVHTEAFPQPTPDHPSGSIERDKPMMVGTFVWYFMVRFVTVAAIVYLFGLFNVTQIMPTHGEEGMHGLFTGFFVSGAAFTLAYLTWFDSYSAIIYHKTASDQASQNSQQRPYSRCPHLVQRFIRCCYISDDLRDHPHLSFCSVLIACLASTVYAHYLRYGATLNPALAQSQANANGVMRATWSVGNQQSSTSGFLLVLLSTLCTLNDAVCWVIAGILLRRLLKFRVDTESAKQAKKMTSPTSEELFNLHSLNQWNPLNSPAGVGYLFLCLIITTIPHSSVMCLIDRTILLQPPSYHTAIVIQFLAEVTGSIISTAVLFSLHQAWCDFSGLNMIPCIENVKINSSSSISPHATTTEASQSHERISHENDQFAYDSEDGGIGSQYRGLEVLVCFCLIFCLHSLPADFIKQLSLSPNVFLPFLSFLIIVWPVFRFGNAGTSVAMLVSFILNSVNVCSNGFGSDPDASSHFKSHSTYPVRWMMLVFQGFTIGLNFCTLVMSSSARQMVELENGLQRVVRVRTRQLQQSTNLLRKQMEIAVKSSDVKSEFLSTMSHEIRTPMNGVIGMAELLSLTSLTPEQLVYVSGVLASSKHLLRIINDILDFSKLENGKMSLRLSRAHLTTVMNQGISLARHERYDHLYVVYDQRVDVPSWIMLDATRLKQVIVNLLSNALKFTEKGGVKIKVKPLPLSDKEKSTFLSQMTVEEVVTNFSNGGGELLESMEIVKLLFTVVDTGIGIPPDQFRHLFQSFGQLDSSSTREYGGTGLGLVISHRIVELMNGKIWAESTVGKGSSFHFTITTFVPNSSFSSSSLAAPSLNVDALDTPHLSENDQPRPYDKKLLNWLFPSAIAIAHLRSAVDFPLLVTSSSARVLIAYQNQDILDAFHQCKQQNMIQIMYSTTDESKAQEYIRRSNPLHVDVCIFTFSFSGVQLIWNVLKQWRNDNPQLFKRSSSPPVSTSRSLSSSRDRCIPMFILFCPHSYLSKEATMSTSSSKNSSPLVFDTNGFELQRRLILSLLNVGLLHVIHQSIETSGSQQQLMRYIIPSFIKHCLEVSKSDSLAEMLARMIIQLECDFDKSLLPILHSDALVTSHTSMTSSDQKSESFILASLPRVENLSNADINLSNFAFKYPRSILVAEDNVINQQVLVSMLNILGYDNRSVSIAVNGNEAVDMASYVHSTVFSARHLRRYFDVIFMDIQMPVVDGLQAAVLILESYQMAVQTSSQLQWHERAPTIIAVTALPASNKPLYLSSGFSDFVSKPYSIRDIQSLLIKWPTA